MSDLSGRCPVCGEQITYRKEIEQKYFELARENFGVTIEEWKKIDVPAPI